MRAALILNPKSRRGRYWASRIDGLLAARNIEIDQRHYPRTGPALLEAGKAVAESKPEVVIIGGGDGTISSLARFFVRSTVAVGILPLGTGNSLARDLELGDSIEVCCDIIAAGSRRRIDLGFAGNDYFVNVATAGVTTHIARHLSPLAKKRFGKLAYFFAVMRAYREARPFEVEFELDGLVEKFQTLQVVIGNGKYHGGPFPLSESASLDDGKLTVYALRSTDRRHLIELARNLVKGVHHEMENVMLREVSKGRLMTAPPVKATIDGELALRTPFDFRVEPGALEVFAPST